MAQLMAKGFISDLKQEQLGEKKIGRTRITLVDDSRKRKVSFLIDFWQDNQKMVSDLKKGDRVIVKAYIDDNSYEVPDNGGNKKVFSLQYTGFDIAKVKAEDLESEFEKAKA